MNTKLTTNHKFHAVPKERGAAELRMQTDSGRKDREKELLAQMQFAIKQKRTQMQYDIAGQLQALVNA